MDELGLLPADLARRSLSPREPVFELDDAITALEIDREHAIGMWGWEAWALYADGRHGHYPGGVIGLSVERHTGESWSRFVQRSIDACRHTIDLAAQEYSEDARTMGIAMQFCLSPVRSDEPTTLPKSD